MARGRPSRRAQRDETAAALAGVRAKSGRRARAAGRTMPPTGHGRGAPARALARLGERQGRNGVDLLVKQSQRHTAGNQDLEPRARAAQLGHKSASVEHLLEVVEQEQYPPFIKVVDQGGHERPGALLGQRQGLGDKGRDEFGVPEGGKVDKDDPVGVLPGYRGRHPPGQAGFTDTARPGQCQQPRLFFAEQGLHSLLGGFPADKRASWRAGGELGLRPHQRRKGHRQN